MPEIHAGWNMEIALLLGIVLTLILVFLIPAISPGFPRPVMTHIYYSNVSTPDGHCIYSLDGRVTNEGTRGNVIVTAELANATNGTTMATSSTMIYMGDGEQKSVRIQLAGLAREPYAVRFKTQRRGKDLF
jgi:hypothetical protein